MLVVSDTSPLCYLLLIDQIDLLPKIYGRVVIPQAVRDELADERSPQLVKSWIEQPPDWLEIQVVNIRQVLLVTAC
jgi:predicted nucleic acid-binding protein